MNDAGNVWSCLWLIATMIQVEKYKKYDKLKNRSTIIHGHFISTRSEIIDESDKLDTIKQQLEEAKGTEKMKVNSTKY